MIDGVADDRFTTMTETERRWLDNVKKAIYASDRAYLSDEKADRCFPELCNAVDTAKTLQRSLRGQDTSAKDNKRRFIEFLDSGIPTPVDGGYQSGELVDARNGKTVAYGFGELIYAIRCMVHENENLNAAERPQYHIQLDWTEPAQNHIIARQYADEKLVLNAELAFWRLRQHIAQFVTSIDSAIAILERGQFDITISPPLGSIKPGENFVYARLEAKAKPPRQALSRSPH